VRHREEVLVEVDLGGEGEQGNAKRSYVLDLRRFEFLGGTPVARDTIKWEHANSSTNS